MIQCRTSNTQGTSFADRDRNAEAFRITLLLMSQAMTKSSVKKPRKIAYYVALSQRQNGLPMAP